MTAELDLRLVAIADERVLADRDIVAACLAAEAGGATCIQLRMKTAPSSVFLDTVLRVVGRVKVPVFVNDRIDVAVLGKASGVHLGWDDLSVGDARSVKGTDGLFFGISVGTPEEAVRSKGVAADYWGSGPVFSTKNKSDAGNAIGISGLAKLVEAAGHVPVVAIGGITAGSCEAAMHTGAAGVAVIGAVFGSGDVEGETKKLRRAIDSATS